MRVLTYCFRYIHTYISEHTGEEDGSYSAAIASKRRPVPTNKSMIQKTNKPRKHRNNATWGKRVANCNLCIVRSDGRYHVVNNSNKMVVQGGYFSCLTLWCSQRQSVVRSQSFTTWYLHTHSRLPYRCGCCTTTITARLASTTKMFTMMIATTALL